MNFNDQPIDSLVWIHRDELTANDYNPNHVAPAEKRLLKTSILEDGWTQPIVINSKNEIVDGFHRWSLSADKDIYAMTDGYVPVVQLRSSLSGGDQRLSTIRHNRARGSHYVLKMSDIVEDLINVHGLTPKEVGDRLEMEDEEVSRLYDHGNMVKRGGLPEFNKGWIVE